MIMFSLGLTVLKYHYDYILVLGLGLSEKSYLLKHTGKTLTFWQAEKLKKSLIHTRFLKFWIWLNKVDLFHIGIQTKGVKVLWEYPQPGYITFSFLVFNLRLQW